MCYIIHYYFYNFNAKTINIAGSVAVQPATEARGGALPLGDASPFVFKRKKRAILGVLLFEKYLTNKRLKTVLPCFGRKPASPLLGGNGKGGLFCVPRAAISPYLDKLAQHVTISTQPLLSFCFFGGSL